MILTIVVVSQRRCLPAQSTLILFSGESVSSHIKGYISAFLLGNGWRDFLSLQLFLQGGKHEKSQADRSREVRKQAKSK